MAQFVHDELADQPCRDFAFAKTPQPVGDVLHRRIYGIGPYRALLQGTQHAATQFLLVERYAAAVFFHHLRQDEFGHLERGEALATKQAFTPTSHLAAFTSQARVSDFRLFVVAEGAMHGSAQQRTRVQPRAHRKPL